MYNVVNTMGQLCIKHKRAVSESSWCLITIKNYFSDIGCSSFTCRFDIS